MKNIFIFIIIFMMKTLLSQDLSVISTDPVNNSNAATVSQIVSIQFDQSLDTTDIADQFLIWGSLSGLIPFNLSVDPSLSSVQLIPAINYMIGEQVNVTARQQIRGCSDSTFSGYLFKFSVIPTLSTPPYFEQTRKFVQFNNFYILPADINDNGSVDLILYGYGTQILINDGTGNFSTFQTLPAGSYVKLTDMDLDSHKDLIIDDYVYEQGTDGFFHYDSSLTPGNWDMNRDGYPDFVYSSPLSTDDSLFCLTIGYNNKSGQIDHPDTLLIDTFITGLTVADFNNDGIQDIAYFTTIFATPTSVGGENSLRIAYLNSQGDTLYRNIYNGDDFPFGGDIGMPFAIISGDFNNDGYNDILLQTNVEDLLILNSTQGEFDTQNAQITGGGDQYHLAFSGDINGDGWLDLVYNYIIGANEHATTMYIMNNSGIFDTNKGIVIHEEEMAQINYSAIADFDYNGALDIVSTWESKGLYLHINHLSDLIPQTKSFNPGQFTILGNYPNPFNSETVIVFYSPKPQKFEFIIYDITGKEVRKYPNKLVFAGVNSLRWDGKDNFGKEVSTGIYFFKKREKTSRQTIRIICIK